MSESASTSDWKRPLMPAIKKGLKCKCPSCGEASAFNGYLEIKQECENCKEALGNHQADDFPPYITIFIVGHIVVALLLMVERSTELSTGAHLAIWIPLTIILSLALLRPIKGAVVGMQWALRMHGFGSGDQFTSADNEDRTF
jgi:uncharacterized protein (DUF983 family)